MAAVQAASIAKRQVRISRLEIDVSLLDKRVALYERYDELLKICQTNSIELFSDAEHQELVLLTKQAQYLFQPDLVDFLHDTVRPKVLAWLITARERVDSDHDEERRMLTRRSWQILAELDTIQQTSFHAQFAPYIELWRLENNMNREASGGPAAKLQHQAIRLFRRFRPKKPQTPSAPDYRS